MQSLFLLALICIGAVHSAPTPNKDTFITFDAWRIEHNKEYNNTDEHNRRLEVFHANQQLVTAHNAGNHTWWMELNEFADLTPVEFSTRLGLRPSLKELVDQAPQPIEGAVGPLMHEHSGLPLAGSVDWRTRNAVTPVKNQGSCGSCWAFSTVVSMEGQVALKGASKKLTSLSEQDLVDCVKKVTIPNSTQVCCDGCQGGLMDYAFAYMISKQSGGDDTETSYPYKGANGACAFKSSSAGGTIKGYKDIPAADENSLLDAVNTVGPISVGVDASLGWQLYGGGVMDPRPVVGCSSKANKMDHGVAAVGYGTDGKDYWIIKNSWGGSWGEKGYLRLVQGKNACGLANGASYPLV